MTEENKPKDDIQSEFAKLGENIRQVVNRAWESEERIRISKEINDGMVEIGDALTRIGTDIAESPSVQQFREDVDDFSERVQSGEVGQRITDDFVSLLQTINQNLDAHIEGQKDADPASESEDEG